MKSSTLAASVVIAASLFAADSYAISAPESTTTTQNFTREQIENIVRDYIIDHPEVILVAQEKLEHIKIAKAEAEKKASLEAIYKNKDIPQTGPGANKAKHFIVEFFDYNCGYCKKAKPMFMDILKNNPDTQYYYMEFPILSQISMQGAKIGLAVYFQNPALYEKYNNELMTRTTRLQNEIELQSLVESLGLNWSKIKEESNSARVSATLAEIRKIAQVMEVTGTPAFIVDGEPIHGAPRDPSDVLSLFKK